MQNKYAEVTPRNFNPMWAPGLSDEARKAVNAAFDAMSTWRIETAKNSEKNSEQVIEKMAAAARALGWPEQIVDTIRAQVQSITKMQIQTMDHMMDAWEEQIKSPMTSSPSAILSKLESLPTFLATFYATILNTMLGVESIDEVYFRAARCLGSKPRHIFFRVVLPGALPYIFTGLQIGVGVGWFTLVAAEMVSGEYGLGFLIWDSYVLSQFEVIVIAMMTLGVIGYLFSALIRLAGRMLMRWTERGMA